LRMVPIGSKTRDREQQATYAYIRSMVQQSWPAPSRPLATPPAARRPASRWPPRPRASPPPPPVQEHMSPKRTHLSTQTPQTSITFRCRCLLRLRPRGHDDQTCPGTCSSRTKAARTSATSNRRRWLMEMRQPGYTLHLIVGLKNAKHYNSFHADIVESEECMT
jgi:hypothetical protein